MKIKLLMLAGLAIFFFSCNTKEEDLIQEGVATISLDVSSSEIDDVDPILFASNKKAVMTNDVVTDQQTFTMPFDNENIMEFTLESTNKAQRIQLESNRDNNNSSIGKKAVTNIYTITPGTKYRVVVYTNQGVYKTQKEFSINQSTKDIIKLDAGQAYTFVFLSYNSTSSIPSPVGTGNLSSQTYTISPNSDFMHTIVQNVTLTEGSNLLQARFKHKSCQIITKIDATGFGTISDIQNVHFGPHHTSASLNLTNGAVTSYLPVTPTIASVSFPTGTTAIKTSTNTNVFSSNSTNGTLSIGSMTIAGITKSNLSITGLNLQSGKRYILSIKIKSPQELTDNLIWASGNLLYTSNSVDQRQNGTYSIATSGIVGSYFPGADIGGPRRYPVTTKVNATDYLLYVNNPIIDPCSLLPVDVVGKPWRVPTIEELRELSTKKFVSHTINGRNGGLFNDIVFFPFSGWIPVRPELLNRPEETLPKTVALDSQQGFYSGKNASNLFFGQTEVGWYSSVPTITWSSSDRPDSYRSGRPVRCVRAK